MAAGRRPLGRAELLSLLGEHGLRPSRALGQNFVADPNLIERIVRLARVKPGDHVLEIGPGLGSLTIGLAATGASVTAVEIDRHLMPALEQVVGPLGVTTVLADAMTCDWEDVLRAAESWVLVANLPYNIATPLVLDLLRHVPVVSRMVVMVQREVGERLAAQPGDDACGAVSVRVAYHATATVVGRVPASVFVPRPKVESVLVELERKRKAPAVPFEAVDELVRAGFAGRRKMLRRGLAGLVTPDELEAAGVPPTARAEELSLDDWCRLAAARGT